MSINDLFTYITVTYGGELVPSIKKAAKIDSIGHMARQVLLYRWAELGRIDSIEVYINSTPIEDILKLLIGNKDKWVDECTTLGSWLILWLLEGQIVNIGIDTLTYLIAIYQILYIRHPEESTEFTKDLWA